MSPSIVSEVDEGLRNRLSVIIRRYTDHMKCYCSFHILLALLCITVYMVVCFVCFHLILYIIQGVPGGKDLTSGECSLGQTIPI